MWAPRLVLVLVPLVLSVICILSLPSRGVAPSLSHSMSKTHIKSIITSIRDLRSPAHTWDSPQGPPAKGSGKGGGGGASGFTGGKGGFLAAMAAAGGWGLMRAASAVEGKSPDRTKILILLSDTGGGHRASARALVDAFNLLRPGEIETEIVDVWTDIAPKPFNNFVQNYQYLAQRPLLWRSLYGFGRWGPFRRSSNEWTNLACNEPFTDFIAEKDPDMIISVHPLCQFVPLRVKRRLGKPIPFVTVVTDLASAHPTWFHKDVDRCFVPTEELARMAKYHGVPDSKISIHGLPIRPEFWSSVGGDALGKPGIRDSLGLVRDKPNVLVVGGGDGVGGIVKTAKAVGEGLDGSNAQMVVVCGKNAEAKKELEAHDWGSTPVRIEGFTNQMSDLMAASDCIVTKAGPGTITEAAIRGLPVMLSSYLPGQEKGNVDYVISHGFGSFSKKPEVIASTVKRWIENPTSMAQMSSIAQSIANPNATFEIAKEIIDLLPDPSNPNLRSEYEIGGARSWRSAWLRRPKGLDKFESMMD
ncbi:hypothetical protein AAMO2058_000414900 [Amorphochlora amoebiformis]